MHECTDGGEAGLASRLDSKRSSVAGIEKFSASAARLPRGTYRWMPTCTLLKRGLLSAGCLPAEHPLHNLHPPMFSAPRTAASVRPHSSPNCCGGESPLRLSGCEPAIATCRHPRKLPLDRHAWFRPLSFSAIYTTIHCSWSVPGPILCGILAVFAQSAAVGALLGSI